jgi:hypothetical protein
MDETRTELRQALPHLQQALRLLQSAVDREKPSIQHVLRSPASLGGLVMSTDNVTQVSGPARPEEPAGYFQVPGLDTVIVWYLRHYQGDDRIEYGGTPEALLASGAVTADMLVINNQSGPRIRRKDQDGIAWRVMRSWRGVKDGVECVPYQWFRVTRAVAGRLDRLPFAREALKAEMARQRWDDAQREADRAVQSRKPDLRMVVNNTRLH